jgi:hypothetical protein
MSATTRRLAARSLACAQAFAQIGLQTLANAHNGPRAANGRMLFHPLRVARGATDA